MGLQLGNECSSWFQSLPGQIFIFCLPPPPLFTYRLCEQSDVRAQAHFSIEEKKEVE